MMNEIKLSIIVPVYNVENYIEKNVLSVIKVLSDEIEVFYIDDGSSDSSIDVLEKYTKNYKNIYIYRKENSGPGATRNYGLDRSKGKFIFFLDSDDYISEIDINRVIDIAINNDLDALEFCYRLVDENGKELVGPNYSSNTSVLNLMSGAQWLRTEKCCSLQVAYLFRREFLLNNSLRMPEGVIHEDMEYVAKCMWYAKRFMKINECIYNYVMRPSSIVHTKGERHSADSYLGIYRTIDFAQKEVDADTYREYFEPYIITKFYNTIHILVQNGENVRVFFKKSPRFRDDLLNWLRKSPRKTRLIQYFFVKYKLYEIYALIYKLYDAIRPNYLSST